ncbi:aminotransferase class I/II-fold pyridoxal phosphate-dependent enzyme [Alteromonas australica]|uniref:Aminotransferase n=1 Tax=Alteromonas australica TaxID=589873 RepID=A0A358DUM1_9ALTE|nr:aminotransferase class I/II-fold pyridoxal phosphate-dependent enzyme [Alteromonas australica]MAB93367.1 aminotransferase [Alteromonas sp.]MBL35856.1 aminotransferase [Oceanospirillaceae bacterium]MBU33818.1 aminotransferase [Alteromonas sp.]HAI71351.1 aminotransferase [Alteromonas australica]HAU26441.1 aminotransferase [Alteromonas australica]
MKFATRATEISPFLAMAYGEKAAQLAATGADVIRLNLGEPDFGAPTPVLDAMKASLDTPDYPYTSALGLPELREAIANFYHKKHGLHVPSSRIVVTAGASAALLLASAALVEPGDNVILGDPSYPCNRRFLNAFGADVTLVPTRSQNNFQLTCNDVKKHWKSNTKGVLIATPANPTGTAICPEELAAIGQICKENNGFLIVDEIYLDLALTPPHQQESAQLHSVLANRNLQDTLIVINSFSKYFGMTGWRLGWSVVPNAMTPIVEKLAQNLFICPSTLSQKAALACFTPGALAQSEENKNTLSVRANIVFNAISTMGLSIDAYPDGAFYAYINISNTELSAIEFCDKLLDTHHVALTPGNDFGEHNASQYVRLSFATEESRLIEGLNRLAQFVASCRK